MQYQFSQDYGVDGRYKAAKGAIDNEAGKAFLKGYLARSGDAMAPDITSQRAGDDRFLFAGPGAATYGFRNAFVPSK